MKDREKRRLQFEACAPRYRRRRGERGAHTVASGADITFVPHRIVDEESNAIVFAQAALALRRRGGASASPSTAATWTATGCAACGAEQLERHLHGRAPVHHPALHRGDPDRAAARAGAPLGQVRRLPAPAPSEAAGARGDRVCINVRVRAARRSAAMLDRIFGTGDVHWATAPWSWFLGDRPAPASPARADGTRQRGAPKKGHQTPNPKKQQGPHTCNFESATPARASCRASSRRCPSPTATRGA